MPCGIPVGDEIAAYDHDLRRTAIYRLSAKLAGVGYTTLTNPDDLELDVSNDGGKLMTIGCRRRASDGGALWYYEAGDDGEPIAEVGHPFDAVVWVKGRANR